MWLPVTLVIIYLVFHSGLNIVCYLISYFYQKKFREDAPKKGFLLYLAAHAALLILVLAFPTDLNATRITGLVIICTANIASITNSLRLYNLMKKISK